MVFEFPSSISSLGVHERRNVHFKCNLLNEYVHDDGLICSESQRRQLISPHSPTIIISVAFSRHGVPSEKRCSCNFITSRLLMRRPLDDEGKIYIKENLLNWQNVGETHHKFTALWNLRCERRTPPTMTIIIIIMNVKINIDSFSSEYLHFIIIHNMSSLCRRHRNSHPQQVGCSTLSHRCC